MIEKNLSCPAKNYSSVEKIEEKIVEILETGETKICVILLSWWIDSSTAALLLKENWYSVIWVHYDFWDTYKTNLPNKCCNNEDLGDAERIALQLDFPFFNLNYKEKFRWEIIDTFIEKKSKWTPFNPCILCHQKIKYWEIFDLVKKYDIKIASWYYCRIENWELYFSKDKNKDQTFSMIMDFKKSDLKYLEFPLGKYLKNEVRCIAKNHKIEKYNKKESMWLCFVWEKKVKDFIKNYCDNKEWKIYYWNSDSENFEFMWKNKLHKWLWLYEVWENSGFNRRNQVPGLEKKTNLENKNWEKEIRKKVPGPVQLFVYKKISEKNILILAEKEKIFHKKFFSKNFNILWELKKWEEKNLKIKYNSNEEEIEWKVFLKNNPLNPPCQGEVKTSEILEITLDKEIQSIIPWQIFVLIDDENWEKIFWWGEIWEFFYEEKFLEEVENLK